MTLAASDVAHMLHKHGGGRPRDGAREIQQAQVVPGPGKAAGLPEGDYLAFASVARASLIALCWHRLGDSLKMIPFDTTLNII